MKQFNKALSFLLTAVMMLGTFGLFTFNVQAATVRIITQPESVTVGDGETGSFKVVAENAASYQWEYYSNGWQQSSVAAEEYGFTGLMKYDGMRYRCIVTGTDIGTGYTVSADGRSVRIVVGGDTDGNGIIDTTDYLIIKKVFLNLHYLEGAYFKAADTDGNGVIDTTDYIGIKRFLLGVTDL